MGKLIKVLDRATAFDMSIKNTSTPAYFKKGEELFATEVKPSGKQCTLAVVGG
jgi:hypothetical protein